LDLRLFAQRRLRATVAASRLSWRRCAFSSASWVKESIVVGWPEQKGGGAIEAGVLARNGDANGCSRGFQSGAQRDQ